MNWIGKVEKFDSVSSKRISNNLFEFCHSVVFVHLLSRGSLFHCWLISPQKLSKDSFFCENSNYLEECLIALSTLLQNFSLQHWFALINLLVFRLNCNLHTEWILCKYGWQSSTNCLLWRGWIELDVNEQRLLPISQIVDVVLACWVAFKVCLCW